MFSAIPEKDWEEQLKKNRRNAVMQRMIDEYIRNNPFSVESENKESKNSNLPVTIPEKDWDKQIKDGNRNKILQRMIEERRKLKFEPRPPSSEKQSSIPEKDWNNQLWKNLDKNILNELIEEFELIEQRSVQRSPF